MKAVVDKLKALLDAPEEGLITWNEAVRQQLLALRDLTGPVVNIPFTGKEP